MRNITANPTANTNANAKASAILNREISCPLPKIPYAATQPVSSIKLYAKVEDDKEAADDTAAAADIKWFIATLNILTRMLIFVWIVGVALLLTGVTAHAKYYGAATVAPINRAAVTLSIGEDHGCAIQTEGTLNCWGSNDLGQATPPTGLYTQVLSGDQFSCALAVAGNIVCWGGNVPSVIAAPTGVFSYLAGNQLESCALKPDNTIACWGKNSSNGQVPPAGIFAQTSPGGSHSCALKIDGTLACWGTDIDGSTNPPAGTFTQVASGFSHACGIKTDGALSCWGSNSVGQISPLPTGTFSQITVGHNHGCGIKSDGTLQCWGDNSSGQATPPAGPFTQVDAARAYTCGMRTDGSLTCWGSEFNGRLTPPTASFGQRHIAGRSNYACGLKVDGSIACWGNRVGFGTPPNTGVFTQLSAGSNYYCSIKIDGTLLCWGDNTSGAATPPAGTFTQVVATESPHACALRTNGTVACWGSNSRNPVSPIPAGTFTQISVGFQQSCGLKTDASVVCWGRLSGAILGAGTFTQVRVGGTHVCGLKADGTTTCAGNNGNNQLDAPSDIFNSIESGNTHSCGIKTNGQVVCWGSSGRLGPGAEAVPPVGTFNQLTLGSTFSCGVRSNGSLACWGSGLVSVVVAAISPAGGTPQSAQFGAAFADALSVATVDHLGGSPEGARITFTAPLSGAAASLSAVSVSTDVNGRAAITATANNVGGSYVVQAKVTAGLPSTNFALTNIKRSQSITFNPATPIVFSRGGTFTLTATATSALTAFIYTAAPPSVCTMGAGNLVNVIGIGICNLTANQAGDETFDPAPQARANVVITATPQTITFAPATPVAFSVAGTFALSASATSGLTAFTFTALPPAVCVMASSVSNVVNIVGGGRCSVTANQAGDATFAAASASADVIVNPVGQTITFSPATPISFGTGVTVNLAATSSSGLTTFSYTALPASVCVMGAGSTLNLIGVGACNLTANQLGNATYSAAPQVSATIVVAKGAQTIVFGALQDKLIDDASFTVAVVGGGSTSPVLITSASPTICSSSGARGEKITPLAIGSCILTASQLGDANFAAANAVNARFNIGNRAVTATIINADADNGSVSPTGSFTFAFGNIMDIQIVANPRTIAVVTGSCGGRIITATAFVPQGAASNTYRTDAITSDCTVQVSSKTIEPTLTISGNTLVTPPKTMPQPTSSEVGKPHTFMATLTGAAGPINVINVISVIQNAASVPSSLPGSTVFIAFQADGIDILGCTAQAVVSRIFDDISEHQASCTTAALSAGIRVITARFAGNIYNAPAITDAAAIPNQALIHNVLASGTGTGQLPVPPVLLTVPPVQPPTQPQAGLPNTAINLPPINLVLKPGIAPQVAPFTISDPAAANGTISPYANPSDGLEVPVNGAVDFIISANPRYLANVSGSCGGSIITVTALVPQGAGTNIYRTNPIGQACTIIVSFTAANPTVTLSGSSRVTPVGTTPAPSVSLLDQVATFKATLRQAVGVVGMNSVGVSVANTVYVTFQADGVVIPGCEKQVITQAFTADESRYQASCSTSALSLGANKITASFSGDQYNFPTITDANQIPSPVLTHTVVPAL